LTGPAAGRRGNAVPLPLPQPTPTFVAPDGWRAIDFISDLHLSAATPKSYAAWSAHLLHTPADAVFILGDLFELWIGDDHPDPSFEARCEGVLREAVSRRFIAFMPGNRDFLVGDAMLARCGVRPLADPTLVAAFGERVLLSHGDALCLADVGYQRFRRVVRHAVTRRAFLSMPRAWRAAAAAAVRRRSRRRHDGPPDPWADVDDAAADHWLAAADAPTLIHGHTHQPRSHKLVADRMRHVLSDWDLDAAHPPRADVLRWQPGRLERIAPVGFGADAAK
jgi:UDP-2,3-diacylglucosamine hydrolase